MARLQRVRQSHELAHGQDGALRHLRRHREQPARRRHRLVGRRPAQNAERIPLLRRRGRPSGRRVAADRRRSADRGNPEGRRPGLLQHHRRAARPRGRQHRPRHRLRGQARRRVHPLQGHEGRRAGHGRLLAGQGHGGEVLPHGAALRLRRRLRRQRPQAGAVDRRVLAEVHAERPHAGHDGRRGAALPLVGGRRAHHVPRPAGEQEGRALLQRELHVWLHALSAARAARRMRVPHLGRELGAGLRPLAERPRGRRAARHAGGLRRHPGAVRPQHRLDHHRRVRRLRRHNGRERRQGRHARRAGRRSGPAARGVPRPSRTVQLVLRDGPRRRVPQGQALPAASEAAPVLRHQKRALHAMHHRRPQHRHPDARVR